MIVPPRAVGKLSTIEEYGQHYYRVNIEVPGAPCRKIQRKSNYACEATHNL